MIAKHARQATCTVQAVTIRTPVEGFNSPVAHAIVFASLGESTCVMISSLSMDLQRLLYFARGVQIRPVPVLDTQASSWLMHSVPAGFPCLELLASFDKVCNKQDFEQEVLRWSQQVSCHDTARLFFFPHQFVHMAQSLNESFRTVGTDEPTHAKTGGICEHERQMPSDCTCYHSKVSLASIDRC